MAESRTTLSNLSTPCFTVDLDVLKRNCETMRSRCETLGVHLRPHMKTHKTREAGELMTNGSRRGIVVSTVREAEFYADAGFDDINFAHVVQSDKMPRLQVLAARLEAFHVLVDCDAQRQLLEESPAGNKAWSVVVKVDVGYHRAGAYWENDTLLDLVASIVNSDRMAFEGLYIHEGQSYSKRGDEVRQTADEAAQRLQHVVDTLRQRGIRCRTVSVGSTPTCSNPGSQLGNITEMHPGNYVFMDAQQLQIGSCSHNDIACRVLTRVLSHYPDRNELVVDCGFLALSHDGKGQLPDGTYCIIEGHPHLSLARISQEYGVVVSADGSKIDFESVPIGSTLRFIPFHSCATAAMHPTYYVHSGETVIDTWEPCRGW